MTKEHKGIPVDAAEFSMPSAGKVDQTSSLRVELGDFTTLTRKNILAASLKDRTVLSTVSDYMKATTERILGETIVASAWKETMITRSSPSPIIHLNKTPYAVGLLRIAKAVATHLELIESPS